MKIIDLDGRDMEVTDLTMAILQADDYRQYRVSEPAPYHLHLYKYWEDLYQKLLILDNNINDNKNGQ
jgi:hypothetical protein